MTFDRLLLYCRAGFEKELAAEITARAGEAGHSGWCRVDPDAGFVEFFPYGVDAELVARAIAFDSLVFARQMVAAVRVEGLPPGDRLAPLLAALGERAVGALVVDTADTNAGKELMALGRKLEKPLLAALRGRGLWAEGAPRLHLFLHGGDSASIGLSDQQNASPWPMGIPRLRFPPGAPSRSTLKLEEAFLTFLTPGERERRLAPAMRAVDLGAAPGGWTYQLVRRHLRVVAIDNGPMDQQLLDSGLVEHRREDGFRYRPQKPVDWMVCDMVEQPARIARLVADWVADGACRETIFNLKLPMKKRYAELERCREIIADRCSGIAFSLRLRQLFHDREEVTGHLRRLEMPGR